MLKRPVRVLIAAAVLLVVALTGGRALVGLYTDALWYSTLGYVGVFWTRLGAGAAVRTTAGVAGAALVMLNLGLVSRRLGPVHLRRRYGNLEIAEQVPRAYLLGGMAVTAVLAGWWLSGLEFGGDASLAMLAWVRHASWGLQDPLFGHDVGFYVFTLPALYRIADFLFLALVWSALLVLLGYVLVGGIRWKDNRPEVDDSTRLHFMLLVAALVALLAVRYWLGRYTLLLDGSGFDNMLGYTDVAARLPGQRGLAVIALITAGTIVYGALRRTWLAPAIALGVLVVGAIVLGQVYPSLVQKLRVEPNQYVRESRYIRWSLEFTRRAYGLDHLERRMLPYRRAAPPTWSSVAGELDRLPLWDPEPLRTAFNQIQAIYGYYHFPQVDYDRYATQAGQRQTAIGVREFYPEGLPETSKNWLTLTLNPKFLRGVGEVLTPADAAGAQGEPVLWLGDVDPVVRSPDAPASAGLTEPSIFVGETTSGYVVLIPGRDGALRGTPGRDFPAGVTLSSWTRLLAFAWRFGDKNLLFSGELTPQSRIFWRRSVGERVRSLAPFVVWDPDPYAVVANGRTYWIVDGYTTSTTFPLSHPLQIDGVGRLRYLRNSVKATVDAVTGAVVFYDVDPGDPVLETYGRIFTGLLRPLTDMPQALRVHLRYPALYFEAQAQLLQQYHLVRPEAFYAGQDVWQLPQESGPQGVPRAMRPMYTTMAVPGGKAAEFLLTVPFIARERQNMTAMLIARNNGAHYGELLLLELPRDQQIPGPGQVQALMEQDPTISPQLTLWRQAGSDVNLGHLRIVPLDSSFLYIQPLFLSAQGSPIPELKRVIVSDGRSAVMDSVLANAVRGLSSPNTKATAAPAETAAAAPSLTPPPATGAWPRRALDLMEEADRRLRAGDFAGFGRAWGELRTLLRGLAPDTAR